MEPKESPVHQVDSDNSATYAEIVGDKSPLRNSWWLQYQSEEEEAALILAIQKSLEEENQVRRNCSILFRVSAELVTHISFTVFQSDTDIGGDMYEDTSEFERHRRRKANLKKARVCCASYLNSSMNLASRKLCFVEHFEFYLDWRLLRYIILQGKHTPVIGTCEVENYSPGKPILPLGCYKYEGVSGTDRFHY